MTNNSLETEQKLENEMADLMQRAPLDVNVHTGCAIDRANEEACRAQAEINNKATLMLAQKGEYSAKQLALLGYVDGVNGVKVKTRPFVMTEHDFIIEDGTICGACRNCHKIWDELRYLSSTSDPGPYLCIGTRAVKDANAREKEAKFGPYNAAKSAAAGRGGGGFFSGRGRSFGYQQK